MIDWYRELNTAERRSFWACFGGWALDALDVQIYTFVVPALIALWHITNAQAGLLATSALVVSAFGGWIAGMLADRIGRARLLMITIAWFAFFTFLSGFTQNFEQLLIVRGFQGLGFGGEWAAGSVLIGEVIRAENRGRAVGTVQSAWAWGWGAAAILATIMFQVLPQEIAWRTLFFVGLLPALLIFYIRANVPEPKIFREAATVAKRRGTLEIFGPDLLATTIVGAVLATGAQGGYYAITTFLPTFLRTQRHLTVMGTGGYLAVIIVGSWVGYIVSAYLNDAIGRFFYLRDRLARHRGGLHPGRDTQLADAGARIPARLLRLGHFQRHGAGADRTLPDQRTRGRAGFLLQFRPRHRRLFPDSGRHIVRFSAVGYRNRHLRCVRLCRGHPRRVDAARDPRPEAAGELKLARRQRAGHGPAISLSMPRHRPFGRQRTNPAWWGTISVPDHFGYGLASAGP
jgi:MFS family permease